MRKLTATLGVTIVAGTTWAQHSEDFEAGYASSALGEILNGQNDYYLPVDGSDSALVFTYDGNALGLPANPTGGKIFVGATGQGNAVFVRSQKDVPYPSGTVRVALDICSAYLGQLPAAQNTGSFSTQTFPGDQTYIHLARWTDINTAETWNADMVWFDAAGAQLTEVIPVPEFQNLLNNNWYRWTGTFNLDTNQVLELTITDLTTGASATYEPPDRYLFGGDAGGAPPPDGFRFFVGANAVPGNTLGFDNLVIEAVDDGCAADLDNDGDADSDDFFAYLDAFAGDNLPVCDIDNDGDCDSDDFFGYLDLFAQGC